MDGHPVPFRLRLPGKDTIDLAGVEEVSYKAVGNVVLEDEALVFEWAATRTTERFSLSGIGTEVSESPIADVEVPVDLISRAQVRRAWWGLGLLGWRLELRSRRLDAFDAIPGGRLGRLTLNISRRDRVDAEALAQAINGARLAG